MTVREPAISRSAWLGPPLKGPARRIVSLVPSLTEAAFRIGVGDALVGRTEFCIRPAGEADGVEAVGGTKNPDLNRIAQLKPDVVLANREENTKKRVLALAREFPVWLTDPQSPVDVPHLWTELGEIAGTASAGRRLADQARQALQAARERVLQLGQRRPSFVYFVWKSPCMAAGHGTYISNLLEAAGFRNGLPAELLRFPKLEPASLTQLKADIHFFSSEPYDFELPRDLDLLGDGGLFRREEKCYISPSGIRARLVEAQKLSWYPSLTVEGLAYAARLLDEALQLKRR